MLSGKTNTAVIVQWALRDAWLARITGQAANYTKTLWVDGVVSAVVVTVAEIGATGEYRATFTPTTEGMWVVECVNAVVGDIVRETIQVYSDTLSDISAAITVVHTGTTTITTTVNGIAGDLTKKYRSHGQFDEQAWRKREKWTGRGIST